MFRLQFRRCFHASVPSMMASRSTALAKLRKATGYSISNCKKALEMFPEDVDKATEWLHAEAKKQGWAKWAKMQERSAAQGLIGVYRRDNVGVMVEVNCETDFVARNQEFQHIVGSILKGCANRIPQHIESEEISKVFLNEDQLHAVPLENSSVGELVTFSMNKFNEKTVAKRALCVRLSGNLLLSSLSHPSVSIPGYPEVVFGKYGSLLTYREVKSVENINASDIGLSLCQHIIGMNPSSVGQLTEKDIARFSKENCDVEIPMNQELIENTQPSVESTQCEGETPQDECETEAVETLDLKETDESRLLFQPYLLDSNVSVGEMLYKSGVEVVDFERFECGEVSAEAVKHSAHA